MNPPVDLDTCADEPIHIPGAIQPHGVLLACSGPDRIVRQVSANVDVLGVTVGEVLGKPLAALLDPASAERLAARFAHRSLR